MADGTEQAGRFIPDEDIWEISISLIRSRMPPKWFDLEGGLVAQIEKAICPNPEEPNHEDRCPLVAIGSHPLWVPDHEE